MKQFKELLLALPAALLLVGVATPAVVFGESSPGGSGPNTVISDTGDSGPVGGDDLGSPLQKRQIEQRREALQQQLKQQVTNSGTQTIPNSTFHDRGRHLLDELVHGRQQHSASQRRQNCTAAEKGLERKLANLQTVSQKYLDRVDRVLSKTLDYQAANNANPDGLADLMTKASDAQAAASDSVAGLQSLSVTLDCGDATVAQTVADFKAAAQDTRTKLLAYRDAVKNLVVALLNAKTGGEQ